MARIVATMSSIASGQTVAMSSSALDSGASMGTGVVWRGVPESTSVRWS